MAVHVGRPGPVVLGAVQKTCWATACTAAPTRAYQKHRAAGFAARSIRRMHPMLMRCGTSVPRPGRFRLGPCRRLRISADSPKPSTFRSAPPFVPRTASTTPTRIIAAISGIGADPALVARIATSDLLHGCGFAARRYHDRLAIRGQLPAASITPDTHPCPSRHRGAQPGLSGRPRRFPPSVAIVSRVWRRISAAPVRLSWGALRHDARANTRNL